MSLVNKMLRDLDARHIGDNERAALPSAVTPLAARQDPGRGGSWRWLGATVAAAVAAGAAWFIAPGGSPELPAAPPVTGAIAPPMISVVPATSTPSALAATGAGLPSLRMADALSVAPALPLAAPVKSIVAAPKAVERPTATDAAARPAVVSAQKAQPVPEPRIDKQVHLPSAAERAEAEYRRGVLAQRQGDANGAADNYRAALAQHAEHAAARQTLAALLIEAKDFDEAEEILRKGTELAPVRLSSTLAWARLKVERNQAPAALEILQKNAILGERSAEYQGFTGALLNRAGRASEAVEHYQAATRLAPGEGRWWAGLGIALDAMGKAAEAREAYLKARALPGLPADLAQHVEQRLR